jgi:hypothetical protein
LHGKDQVVVIVVGARGAGRARSQIAELGAYRLQLPVGSVNVVDKVCAPALVGTIVLMNVHDGLLALAA